MQGVGTMGQVKVEQGSNGSRGKGELGPEGDSDFG